MTLSDSRALSAVLTAPIVFSGSGAGQSPIVTVRNTSGGVTGDAILRIIRGDSSTAWTFDNFGQLIGLGGSVIQVSNLISTTGTGAAIVLQTAGSQSLLRANGAGNGWRFVPSAGQTAFITEWTDSTQATTVARVSADGSAFFSGLTIADASDIVFGTGTGTKIGTATTQKLAFFNSTPIVKPTVAGSKGANAALASLMTALAALGLCIDTTT